jgi:hypothetical protein
MRLASFLHTHGCDACHMLKIERLSERGAVFSLSGRIEAEDMIEVQKLLDLESPGQGITFDLREITIVDRDAVQFLERCEASGIKFRDCPAYIREWIETERGRGSRLRD